MQERFPGIGNWMADEILWRARLNPRRPGGDLGPGEARVLWRATREVCRRAIDVMDQNWEYPDAWLFAHRWEDGGRCPRCRTGLLRAAVGGRTTCWCPRCQPETATTPA
jgi:formamidopyrimidine-DNA glycosylase